LLLVALALYLTAAGVAFYTGKLILLPFECEAGLCKLVLFVLGNLSKVTRSVFT
jgi:hypothetical protein